MGEPRRSCAAASGRTNERNREREKERKGEREKGIKEDREGGRRRKKEREREKDKDRRREGKGERERKREREKGRKTEGERGRERERERAGGSMSVQRVARLVAMLALGLCAGGLWARTGPAKIVMMSAVGRVAESAAFFGAVVAAVLGGLLLLWAVLRGTGRLCAAVASFEPNVITDAVLVGGTCVTCWLGWRAGLGGPDTTFFAWCAAANVAMWSAAAAARLALPAVLVVVRAFSRRGGLVRSTLPFGHVHPPSLCCLLLSSWVCAGCRGSPSHRACCTRLHAARARTP